MRGWLALAWHDNEGSWCLRGMVTKGRVWWTGPGLASWSCVLRDGRGAPVGASVVAARMDFCATAAIARLSTGLTRAGRASCADTRARRRCFSPWFT